MKRIVIFFIIFLLFFNCENRKKKGILHSPSVENLILFFFFTDGGSYLMNNCDIRYKYTVRKVNEFVSGTDQVAISKYYSMKEGNYLYVKNLNSSSNCIVRASFTFCDFLNNQTTSWMNSQRICRNQSQNYIEATVGDIEKKCYLNGDLLGQFSNSIIVSVWASNESSTSSEKCIFYGEMK